MSTPRDLLERLQVIRDSGMQPSEQQLNRIHSDVQAVLPQITDSQERSRIFELLEQIHDLPEGGRRRVKRQSRRKTRRGGSSRP